MSCLLMIHLLIMAFMVFLGTSYGLEISFFLLVDIFCQVRHHTDSLGSVAHGIRSDIKTRKYEEKRRRSWCLFTANQNKCTNDSCMIITSEHETEFDRVLNKTATSRIIKGYPPLYSTTR